MIVTSQYTVYLPIWEHVTRVLYRGGIPPSKHCENIWIPHSGIGSLGQLPGNKCVGQSCAKFLYLINYESSLTVILLTQKSNMDSCLLIIFTCIKCVNCQGWGMCTIIPTPGNQLVTFTITCNQNIARACALAGPDLRHWCCNTSHSRLIGHITLTE